MIRLCSTLAAAMAMVLCLGCSPGLAPAQGKVLLPGGQPAAGSQVVVEGDIGGKLVSARGDVAADGAFHLSTFKPGDGVPPGRYKVQINPPPLVNAEGPNTIPFNAKFTKFDTSGIQFDVKPGQKNDFLIQTTK